MLSFLCTEFTYTEKQSTNLIYRFEIYIVIWEIYYVYIHGRIIHCSMKNTEQIF